MPIGMADSEKGSGYEAAEGSTAYRRPVPAPLAGKIQPSRPGGGGGSGYFPPSVTNRSGRRRKNRRREEIQQFARFDK